MKGLKIYSPVENEFSILIENRGDWVAGNFM